MDGASFGNSFLNGINAGFSIRNKLDRDKESDRRFEEQLEFRNAESRKSDQRYREQITHRNQREGVLDQRYQDEQEYKRSLDEIAKQRADRAEGRSSELFGIQKRNLNQQHNINSYNHKQTVEENDRKKELREIDGFLSLIETGDDNGMVAEYLNQLPDHKEWLASRGLNNAKFNSLKLNTTGKGPEGVVTVIEGEDKKTKKSRLGVATVGATSDPDDPVDVMPMEALAEMVDQKASELDEQGDTESAERLRQALITRLKARRVSLGGQTKPKWGKIQHVDGAGYGQYDTEGQFHQLDPNKDPYGRRGTRGLGGDKNANARQSQLYRQVTDVFPDDDVQGIDRSEVRNLTVSLAQDIDLRTGGALAPGIYGQIAKESEAGLALDQSTAMEQAKSELSKGSVFGSWGINDEDTQARANEILARDKEEFANRMTSSAQAMIEARYGQGQSGQSVPQQSQPQPQQPQSLDDAVKMMVDNARSQGKEISDDQARQFMMQKYPDRFGGETASVEQPGPSEQESGPKYGGLKKLSQNFENDIAGPVRRGLKGLRDNINSGVANAKADRDFDVALSTGKPTVEGLAQWIPNLSPKNQEKAIAIMTELYPDNRLTKQVLGEYNQLAGR